MSTSTTENIIVEDVSESIKVLPSDLEDVTTTEVNAETTTEYTTNKIEASEKIDETFKETPTLKPIINENTSESIDGKSAANIIFFNTFIVENNDEYEEEYKEEEEPKQCGKGYRLVEEECVGM